MGIGSCSGEPVTTKRSGNYRVVDRARPRTCTEVPGDDSADPRLSDSGGPQELPAPSDAGDPGQAAQAASGAAGPRFGPRDRGRSGALYRRAEPNGAGGGSALEQRLPDDPAMLTGGRGGVSVRALRSGDAKGRDLAAAPAGGAGECAAHRGGSRGGLQQLQTRLGSFHGSHANSVFFAPADREENSSRRLRSDRRHYRVLSEAESQLFAGGCAAARGTFGCGFVEFAGGQLRRRGYSACAGRSVCGSGGRRALTDAGGTG